MSVKEILDKIGNLKDCSILPPLGSPIIAQNLKLPEDLR